MANLAENTNASFDSVRRIETNDPVLGGAPEIIGVVNSPYNFLAQALVNRDNWLKAQIETLKTSIPDAVQDASTTVAGKVRLATLPEMRTGTNTTAVATARGVKEAIDQIPEPNVTIPDATTTQKGKVELATRAEGRGRTLTNVVLTPDALDAALDNLPSSSESQKGFIERATQTEAETATDNQRALTALRTKQLMQHSNAQASETQRGTVKKATQQQVNTGTNDTEYLTPKGLKDYTNSLFSIPSGVITAWGAYNWMHPSISSSDGIKIKNIIIATVTVQLTHPTNIYSGTTSYNLGIEFNAEYTIASVETINKGFSLRGDLTITISSNRTRLSVRVNRESGTDSITFGFIAIAN